MTRKEEPIDDYDPETATFWGRFVTEFGHQEKHAHTIALYSDDDGFFVVNQAPGKTGPGQGIFPEGIDDPQGWLDELFKDLKIWMG